MFIKYFSDIHLELLKPDDITKIIENVTNTSDQICVLAGDIGNPYSDIYDTFMKHISSIFNKSFVIAGNHEYYNNNKTVDETNDYLVDYFKKYENISFLNNSYELYKDYLFVGTTLWSRITDPEYESNDIYSIKSLNYISYNNLNRKSLEFLNETKKLQKRMIIITHHIPSRSLISEKYKTPKMAMYNQWFYSNMDKFILENKEYIKCWIYGHTHIPSDSMIHNIPFICNPIGYKDENVDMDFNKTIEIN